MSDDLNEIRISITLDDGSVREGFARIQKDGEDSGKKLGDAFDSVKNKLLAIAGAYIGFEAIKRVFEDSITDASNYDTALNNLNKSLSLAGGYSADASRSFQELAETLDHTTNVSATQALSLEALARNYAATNEQAQQLTKAAVDLASATGKDATTALQQLGGTLDGTAGRLGKLIPQVRSLTEYQLRTGDAIAIVAARFKDAAQGDVNTYQGALNQLAHAFEELRITVGSLVTQSPAIRAVFQFLTTQVRQLSTDLKGIGDADPFGAMIIAATNFGLAFTTWVVAPIENTVHLLDVLLTGFKVVSGAASGLEAELQNKMATSTPGKFIGQFFDTTEARQKRLEAVQLWRDTLQDFSDAKEKYGDFDIALSMQKGLEGLQSAVINAAPIIQSFRTQTNPIQNDLLRMSGQLADVGDAWDRMQQGASSSLKLLNADASKYMQEIGANVSKTLIGGVANAMAAMGKALVKGQDIFAAFAGAMLAALGQAAVQMGAAYILMGVARLASSYGADPTGWELIETGGAMSVLGGVLMALGEGASGGSGSAVSADTSSGGAGGSGGGSFDSGAVGNPASQVQTQSRIQVVIQGSVFDTQQTGLRIVDLINDAFDGQGAVVRANT